MPDDLLASAREQAERSDAAVRAAALLRIARVETASDPPAARTTFDRGLEAIRGLSGIEGEFLLEQAALVAGAVAPDLLAGAPTLRPTHMFERKALEIMLDHGHVGEAVSYLMNRDDTAEFPFRMVQAVMWRVGKGAVKLALLRRVIEAWRNAPPHDPMRPPDDDFVQLFQSEWNALPREEALTVVREIIRVTLEQPERPLSSRYFDAVEITSWRAHVFFQILHVLRHLDPSLADSLIAGHAQLANAARRFPKGHETMKEEAEARRRDMPPRAEGGWIMMGSRGDFQFGKSLHQSSRDGDFGAPLEYALKKYREDSDPADPNRAPREFWPSTVAYRNILYRAGKQLGPDAELYLQRVPDNDLRLFAQIELAAALAGLPEFREMQREFRPRASGAREVGRR